MGLVVVAVLAGLGAGACQRRSASGPKVPPHATVRDNQVVHEACEGGEGASGELNTQRFDANADGNFDLVVVREGGRERCRWLDFNFDGRVDTWVYRDERGQERRRESDFDRDGRVDEIVLLSQGQLVQKQRATTLSGKLDTWHFYRAGKIFRTERDANQDRIIDQWWEYPDNSGCAHVHVDLNRDGRPDPGGSVRLCPEGKDAASAATSGATPAVREGS
ncbi:MAG TPA: hypothetical protein VHO25_00195 [Polyangiaceae bacterium]|nr:hypothetical protein [Polyangiaceae bacterium]